MKTENEKEYLLKAVDAIEIEVAVMSPEFKILAANRFSMEKHGRDIVGGICYQVFHNRSERCDSCPQHQVVLPCQGKDQKSQHCVSLIERGFSSRPIYSDGKLDAIILCGFDQSCMEIVEEQLQMSDAFLHNLSNSAIDGIVAADMSGKIILFNNVAEEISGFTIAEALGGLNIRDFYRDNYARRVMRDLRREEYGGKGKLKSYRVDYRKRDDKVVPISLDAAIVYEDDKEIATIGFFHDLTEELRIAKSLADAQAQLLQSEKMASIGKLAAGVAHQLNNPLGGIILFSKLMMEEYDLVKEAKDDLRRIILDAERCRDIVKELLEFSRQTSHLMQPHDMNKALTKTLFLLKDQTLFHNIEIEDSLEPTLPFVTANIQQMNHVFMNLLLNAADAMEGKGKLTITSYMLSEKNRVCIEISDTGPGIPEEIKNQIFEPFFTTKEEGKGTGLGLSMVYGIVEEHGGIINVKSKPDQGTTFYIELPIALQDNKGDEDGE
ncbi:MAG: PAS domain S-box protein [Desulfosarcina sp.]|nr:PAS domain S-box protein [Desulfobacterales bacterium]